MTLLVFDSMGQIVNPGEPIASRPPQSKIAKLIRATRAQMPGKSGKVYVEWAGNQGRGEYYADIVFDLHVKEVSEEEPEIVGRFHYDGDMTYDQHQMYIDAEHNV